MCRGPVWNLSSYFTCQCTKAKPTKGWITNLPLGPRHPQASEVRDSLYVSPKPICYYQRRTVTLYVCNFFLRLNDFLKQMDNVVFRWCQSNRCKLCIYEGLFSAKALVPYWVFMAAGQRMFDWLKINYSVNLLWYVLNCFSHNEGASNQ